jgi:hypothetical protein
VNIALKTLTCAFAIVLVACGVSTSSDIASAPDANNIELARAQEEDARAADAHAAASREINGATLKLNLKQARVDYGEAIAKANHDLSDALKKCKLIPARALPACEADARSIRDQSTERAKVRLSLADQ